MKKLSTLLILLVALPLAADKSITLNVMSFNIRYGTANDGDNSWPNRDHLVFGVLKNHNPDIVGLQEALKFQIDEILDNVPAYAMVGVGRDDGDTLGEYSAILYKPARFEMQDSGTFWLSETPDIIASTSWGNKITRICTWACLTDKNSGRSFYVYNVHLDHKSQNSREKSTELVMRKINERGKKAPFVLTGDFNAGEDNAAITFLTESRPTGTLKTVLPMRDTFRVLFPDVKKAGTFNGFKGRTSGDKIDYIFIPHSVKVIDAAIIHDNENGRYPSDHVPVSATLEF